MNPAVPLAAILAGGRSRRFGAPKALAEVGGRTIIERVRDALAVVSADVVLIANEPELYDDLGLPTRPDTMAGHGPLGGIHAALGWADEESRPGALCVACDLPFLAPELLGALLERAENTGANIVAPESTRGPEPLCAVYGVACLPEIERRLGRGERETMALLDALDTERLPLARVRRYGDPETVFLNVNTRADHRRARRIAREREAVREHV